MKYIWQHKDWPNFTWDSPLIEENAYSYALEASRLVGEVQHLSKSEKIDTFIDLMVSEAVKTSQIEGETFDQEDVRSSIRNQLGLNPSPEVVYDPRASGVAALMIAVRDGFNQSLTKERLWDWQKQIISNSYHGANLEVGKWRTTTEPMQIISGAIGRERIHYEAPPSQKIPSEMARFIQWFNTSKTLKGSIRAGVAHLYFECLHPFSDGNGRIGRALSEMALSQELGHPALLSLSTTIQSQRQDYYQALNQASLGDLDITEWLVWFTKIVLQAQKQTKGQINFVMSKARFWKAYGSHLNERQSKVLRRMLKEGVEGFEGGMSAQKYTKIAHCSKATATRDLGDLLAMGILKKCEGLGRSTRYTVVLPK